MFSPVIQKQLLRCFFPIPGEEHDTRMQCVFSKTGRSLYVSIKRKDDNTLQVDCEERNSKSYPKYRDDAPVKFSFMVLLDDVNVNNLSDFASLEYTVFTEIRKRWAEEKAEATNSKKE